MHTVNRAARCPAPLVVAGCACYSDNANCRGASFERMAIAPSAVAAAHEEEVCNVSHAVSEAADATPPR